MEDMNGQVALVTGGIRGIGTAICARLAARGVIVAAGYSRDKEAADRFCEQYPGSSTHQGNIGSNEDCERVVREVLDQHGRLDILVNNAGITADKTVRKMAADDWDRVIQVNLSGAFYLIPASLQRMLDRGSGRIINISSIIGEAGNIGPGQLRRSEGRPPMWARPRCSRTSALVRAESQVCRVIARSSLGQGQRGQQGAVLPCRDVDAVTCRGVQQVLQPGPVQVGLVGQSRPGCQDQVVLSLVDLRVQLSDYDEVLSSRCFRI
jgi:NAD(P)-dependent dehydrogenase (short-subunit alcohol dehydrogenase family)